MNPYDAAALFWYVRNYFFFHLNLDKREDVMMCSYEDFVKYPDKFIKNIYYYFDLKYPGDRIVSEVHSRATNKGKNVELSKKN